jgi:4-azaleucine resistance transporter AzlC
MVPLWLGVVPFALAYAVTARGAGLSLVETQALSALVFAGSAQFIAVTLIGSNALPAVIILTTLVVNLRHALYSTTLAPHVKHLKQRWLVPLAFWLTDETFMVVAARYNRQDASPYKHWFFLGSEVFMYLNWQLCTLIGIIAGQTMQNAQSWGLDFAMVATFIGMLIPFVRNRATRISVMVSGVAAILTYPMPNKLGLIVAALLGIGAGMLAEIYWPDSAERAQQELML